MKKGLTNEKKYNILFCLAFFDFLLCAGYLLLSIVVIGKISTISVIVLLGMMLCSIYFVVRYQYESNKEIEKKNSKNKIKSKKTVKKKANVYNNRYTANRSKYNQKQLKEQIQ